MWWLTVTEMNTLPALKALQIVTVWVWTQALSPALLTEETLSWFSSQIITVSGWRRFLSRRETSFVWRDAFRQLFIGKQQQNPLSFLSLQYVLYLCVIVNVCVLQVRFSKNHTLFSGRWFLWRGKNPHPSLSLSLSYNRLSIRGDVVVGEQAAEWALEFAAQAPAQRSSGAHERSAEGHHKAGGSGEAGWVGRFHRADSGAVQDVGEPGDQVHTLLPDV